VKRAAQTQTLLLLVGVTILAVSAAFLVGDVLEPTQPPAVRAVEIGKSRDQADRTPANDPAPDRKRPPAGERAPGAPRVAPVPPPASALPPVSDDGGGDDDGD
jgi:hypothetical protein